MYADFLVGFDGTRIFRIGWIDACFFCGRRKTDFFGMC